MCVSIVNQPMILEAVANYYINSGASIHETGIRVAAVEGFIEGTGEPVHLMLHDWGGFFGYPCALPYPQRVAILLGSMWEMPIAAHFELH